MKRTSSLSILALVAAALLPLAAIGQVASAQNSDNSEGGTPTFKYEGYIGYGYTAINQINGSRYGLQGVELSITRDWGKHFGVIADGATYKYPFDSSADNPNPGNPQVDIVLFGPVFEAKLFGHTSMFGRALLGAEHSGGEQQTPNVSFAGGIGVGMDYQLSTHMFLRAAGDDIASSFSDIDNTSQLALSPHRTRSARATIGIAYKF